MAHVYNKPDHLKLEGNLEENFNRFKQEVSIYFTATETDTKKEPIKIARVLNLVGPEALRLYNTFKITPSTADEVLKVFEDYCIPQKNEVMEHFRFFSRKQFENESFDVFYTDLKALVASCSFETLEKKMLRTQIIIGLRNKELQARLLRENLELDKLVKQCQAMEQAEINRQILQEESKEVNVMGKGDHKFKKQFRKRFHQQEIQGQSSQTNVKIITNCKRCGSTHSINECYAYGKKCNKCSKLNHFANCCKFNSSNHSNGKSNYNNRDSGSNNGKNNQVHNINCEVDIDKVVVLSLLEKNGNDWSEKVLLNNCEVNIKIDTGAEVNVLPASLCKKLNLKPVACNVKIEAFGGFVVKPLGKINVALRNDKIKINTNFIVVENETKPILGLIDCKRLGYVNNVKLNCQSHINKIQILNDKEKENFVNKNIDIFTGMGSFPDEVSIKLNNEAKSKICPARRVPYAIKNKLKETLNELVSLGIIEEVNEPCEWVSNMVIVEKKDKSLRICLDPSELNKYIIREVYQIPSLEEIKIELTNKKYFSVLDVKSGFYHMVLDKVSSKIFNFSTPYGIYRFKRLPFGVSSAPELFQKSMYKYFGDINGVVLYFDDVLVCAQTKEEHDKILEKVMERAGSLNIKFNMEKLQFCVKEVKYIGFLFNEEGIKPDKERIKSILDLKKPNNKKELQIILGIINYIREFIPNLAEISGPLREMLKKDVCWSWNWTHDKSFNDIKELIAQVTVLHMYDPKLQLEIQCDASQDAIGCCLMQNKKPLSYFSRSLSDTEKSWAQIEKEFLAVTESCKKFHNYIYGKNNTIVYTDHLPLVSIMNKQLSQIQNNRIKRLKLKLIPYTFNLKYLPGKYMYIADLLSRNILNERVKEDSEINDIVHTVKEYEIRVTEEKLKELRSEVEKDEVLSRVLIHFQQGWVAFNKEKESQELIHYFRNRSEILVNNGIVYFGSRVIVPRKLRKIVITLLHETHIGSTKTYMKARNFYYWPGMKSYIENFISACNVCQKYSKSKTKEPMLSHEIPDIPFMKVAMDIAENQGKIYLIVYDYYSRWLEVCNMRDKTAESVIKELKAIFSKFGVPEQTVSDNNPFNSAKFRDFANSWSFEVITSSPNYPKGNGLAEKGVDIAKSMLKKSSFTKTDIELYLLYYRNTPIAGVGYSPAQMLQSRELRTKLVWVDSKNFKPKIVYPEKNNIKYKEQQKQWYDRGSKSVSDFSEKQKIWCQDKFSKEWFEAEIVKKLKQPRSYLVKMNNKSELVRRNSQFLKPRGSFKYDTSEDNNQSNKCSEERMNYDDLRFQGSNIVNDEVNIQKNDNDIERNNDSLDTGNNSVNDELLAFQNIGHTITKSGRVVKPPSKFE